MSNSTYFSDQPPFVSKNVLEVGPDGPGSPFTPIIFLISPVFLTSSLYWHPLTLLPCYSVPPPLYCTYRLPPEPSLKKGEFFMLKMCPECHTVYKSDDDLYCRSCGSKRLIDNHCKKCGLLCDFEDLFCPQCGSETEIYDIIAR